MDLGNTIQAAEVSPGVHGATGDAQTALICGVRLAAAEGVSAAVACPLLVVSCRAERDSQNEILQAPLEAV